MKKKQRKKTELPKECNRKLKRTFFGMMLALCMVGSLGLVLHIQPVKAEPGTIYIRADGSIDPPTAQISTLDNVTYIFTDNINDSIVVERNNIIIDGNGYTLQGTGVPYSAGLSLNDRRNVTIREMEVKTFDYGISLLNCSSIIISGNNITNNNWFGLLLHYSSRNIISGNNITDNNNDGVCLWIECNSNIVSGNNMKSNFYGVEIDSSSENTILENDMTANRNSGIYMSLSYRNTIHGNNIANNTYHGIDVSSSSNNVVSGNIIVNNEKGIQLWDSSSNNTVHANSITNNAYGIYLGGLLSGPSNNMVYHNNFINNTIQVNSYDSTDAWDNGYPSGGNYWSDYAGIDANHDGIGDTPYMTSANSIDHYPLMTQYVIPEFPSFSILPLFFLVTLLKVTIYKRKYAQRE
jgi:parallel beta-helix repeat protein